MSSVLPADAAGVVPAHAQYASFGAAHVQRDFDAVEVGAPLLIVDFPLGFHDKRHQLPVARTGTIASSYGVRFQGEGAFLTDAGTHRGMSGAPVVMRSAATGPDLPFTLLGIHSSRIEMNGRDLQLDDSLGLNCAWYADILLTLTGSRRGVAGACVAFCFATFVCKPEDST